VCVEVNISVDKNFRLADAHRIDSIPRTIIFTPELDDRDRFLR
jgi:hypothetical protein